MTASNRPESGELSFRVRMFASSICGSKLLTLLIMIPFLKSSLFDYFGMLSQLANAMLVVEVICFAALFLASGFHSKLLWLLVAFFCWDLIIAPLASGNEPPSAYYCMQALGFALFVMLGLMTNKVKALDGLSLSFCLVSIFNYLFLLAYPDGVVATLNGSLWLFGIRTGFSLVLVPGIFFCLLYDSCRNHDTFSLRTWLMIIVAVATLVNQWVATGIVELVILSILFAWAKFRGFIDVGVASIVVAAMTLALLFLGPSTLLGDFVDALGKDMTFSGRTEIWAAVMLAISLQPLFGYGSISYVLVNGGRWACHDLWLNIGHESGIVGLALYIPAYVYSAACLNRVRTLGAGRLAGIFFVTILVAAIVEIQTYFPFIYGVLAVSEVIAAERAEFEDTSFPVPMKLR